MMSPHSNGSTEGGFSFDSVDIVPSPKNNNTFTSPNVFMDNIGGNRENRRNLSSPQPSISEGFVAEQSCRTPPAASSFVKRRDSTGTARHTRRSSSQDMVDHPSRKNNIRDEEESRAGYRYSNVGDVGDKDRIGVKSFQIPTTAWQNAKAKIRQAQLDRDNSSIPKALIPLAEAFLPSNKTLGQLEADVRRLCGACLSSDDAIRISTTSNTDYSQNRAGFIRPEGMIPGTGANPPTSLAKDTLQKSAELLFETEIGKDCKQERQAIHNDIHNDEWDACFSPKNKIAAVKYDDAELNMPVIAPSMNAKIAAMATGAPKVFVNPPAFFRSKTSISSDAQNAQLNKNSRNRVLGVPMA